MPEKLIIKAGEWYLTQVRRGISPRQNRHQTSGGEIITESENPHHPVLVKAIRAKDYENEVVGRLWEVSDAESGALLHVYETALMKATSELLDIVAPKVNKPKPTSEQVNEVVQRAHKKLREDAQAKFAESNLPKKVVAKKSAKRKR